MAIDSSDVCQSFHTVMVLAEGTTDLQCEPPRFNIDVTEVCPIMVKSEMCETNLSNGIKVQVENYVPCITDIENEILKPDLRSDHSKGALLRELYSQIGVKFMLMMNNVTEFPKLTSRDRVHDTVPCHRSRKYKRSSSFNSRRVVLLSSVLSIMGTVILIYMTLRLRNSSDGSGNL